MFKNINYLSGLKYILMFSVFSLVLTNMAFAQEQASTIGDVARLLVAPLKNLDVLFKVFCLIAGLVLVIIACFKLKEWSDTKGQAKIQNAVLYMIGGICLLMIVTVMQIGTEVMGIAGEENKYVQDGKFKY